MLPYKIKPIYAINVSAKLWEWLFFIFVGCVVFYLFSQQSFHPLHSINLPFHSDIPEHIKFSKLFFNAGYLQKTPAAFEPGLALLTTVIVKTCHLNYELATALILTIAYLTFTYLLYQLLSNKFAVTKATTPFLYNPVCTIPPDVRVIILLCLSLQIVTCIFIPFFSTKTFAPIGSPNIWHSPTYTLVKPFALYITYKVITLIEKPPVKQSAWYFLALLLILSALAKPCFVEVFIPTLFIYLALNYKNLMKTKLVWRLVVLILPITLLALFQAITWHHNNSIIFDPFGVVAVWHVNPLVGIIQAIAFPLAVAATIKKKISSHLIFCWLMTGISHLQFMLFAESGKAYTNANLSWPFNISLSLLFIFSAIDLIRWVVNTYLPHPTKKDRSLLIITIVIFALHLITGIFYACNIFTGGSYGLLITTQKIPDLNWTRVYFSFIFS